MKKAEQIALIVLCIIPIFLLFIIFGQNEPKMEKQKNYSNLIDTKEIGNLSVSEFVYNGIAQCYNGKKDPEYNVLYKSTVKTSVDVDSIRYAVDDDKKIATFTFPAFTIENPVIDISSIRFIPEKDDLYMDEVISLCRSDALTEAQKSDKLISMAQENLKTFIEAWYSPVLDGYTFECVFNTEEGGETE